jgi:hypothetical protein
MKAFMLSMGKSGLSPETIGEAVHTALTAASPEDPLRRSRPTRSRCS